MVDESTAKKSDIRRGMLVPVRFFDSAIDRCVTRLLDLRKVHREARHSLRTVFTDTITAYWQCILNIVETDSCTHCDDKWCFTSGAILYSVGAIL